VEHRSNTPSNRIDHSGDWEEPPHVPPAAPGEGPRCPATHERRRYLPEDVLSEDLIGEAVAGFVSATASLPAGRVGRPPGIWPSLRPPASRPLLSGRSLAVLYRRTPGLCTDGLLAALVSSAYPRAVLQDACQRLGLRLLVGHSCRAFGAGTARPLPRKAPLSLNELRRMVESFGDRAVDVRDGGPAASRLRRGR
jgi:hypothetical protein